MNNYVCLHLHSDLSNATTNIDSITKFEEYINKAKEYNMTSLAFSEHGNIFEWWHKKSAIESAGMKYIHAVEVYITESLEEKIRDNYHCILIAKNYDGFKELNQLLTHSFNRKNNHFYYTPRISIDELFQTSNNIIITTACIGGVLYKGNEEVKKKYLEFIIKNKDRCFLEIQHHPDIQQVIYNKELYKLSQQHDLKLVTGTDTHALNTTHVEGRKILQKAKKIYFPEEDGWDLTFKSYDELCESYTKQNSIPQSAWETAIENTNVIADSIQPFELNKDTKYPKIYDDPINTFKKNIEKKKETHPYLNKRYPKEKTDEIVESEIAVYEKTKSIDFMLLQEYLRDWEKSNDIQCGYSRGSVSGSLVAYILGITDMDSIKFDLNFFRFQNPSRISNCDIDTDYGGKDRDIVKKFLLDDHMNLPQLNASEIITFNTIALKGAIRDVGRALEIPLETVDEISKQCDSEEDTVSLRKKYPELFKYVDIVNGTIVSVGTHPSGVLISDLNIEEQIGMCSTSTSDYPISMLNMKELDDLMYVKLDILGLDNIAVINETCKTLGIDRLTPDNVDLEDISVWKSIRDDTTSIFQWESPSAHAYLKKFMSDNTLDIVHNNIPNFSLIKWFSFGNGLIRPACASYRNSVAEGKFYDNGFSELNEFLKPTMGYVTMQEDIMQFLVKFCGYSQAESDIVRRGIAKKKGTEHLIPEIESRFIQHSSENFSVSKEQCAEIIKPFLQTIISASEYAFSWNHSDSYSCIGYVCGYLRYYHPLEFLTSSFNTFTDNEDKTIAVTKYARKLKITINPARFRYSKSMYNYEKSTNSIYKGMSSIKFLNPVVSDELYNLRNNQYKTFMDLLLDIKKTSLNSKQLDILIKLDYFIEFGNSKELLRITDVFDMFKQGEAKQISKEKLPPEIEFRISLYVDGNRKDKKPSKSFTILDMPSVLKVISAYIKELQIPDFDFKNKIQNQFEYLGYIDLVTGKEEDRPKLFVKNIFPLKRKKDNKQFGYNILTRSIGSGVESSFTVFNKVFDKDVIRVGDIIRCNNYSHEGKYFTLLAYQKIG